MSSNIYLELKERKIKMPKIELKYFPIHGFRGLLARLVLHLSEIEYTEKVIAFEDWDKVQKSKNIDLNRFHLNI